MTLAFGSPCNSIHTSSSYNAFLNELQKIWTEIGESEADKDRMLLELERECLEIYRRKVDEAATAKVQLHQSVATKEAELAMLMATLGEIHVNSPIQSEKKAKSLKDQFSSVTALVEDLTLKKQKLMKQFADIKAQIEKITSEISGNDHFVNAINASTLEERDLSQRKLTEYQSNLHALQKEKKIWTEIGESEADKDRMLLELERECLEIYRRKVDEAATAKVQLHQSVATKEAELAMLMATLGEIHVNSPIQSEKKAKSLKDQFSSVTALVEDLTLKKQKLMKQFADIKAQIEKITSEISGNDHFVNAINASTLEERDLSQRKLTEYQSNLHALQKEKSERLRKVFDYVNEVHSLCAVLGLDFDKTVNDVHPSWNVTSMEQSWNISDSTLEGLNQSIMRLKTEKKFRYQKLKDVASSLFDLWNLMDATKEEKIKFLKNTSILDLTDSAIMEPGSLSMEIIEQVSVEVERLTKLKASRMKELVMRKRSELEYICCKNHIQPDSSTASDKTNPLIDAGLMSPFELLANIEAQIEKTKNEALSRKEITDRIYRWLSACDEENWLENYNQDENRYSAGRGTHVNLKRAERARITINKIPVMVDNLISKTLAWEDEQKKLFLYDGVHLVSILEEYKLTRQQREEEKQRARDQKKLHDMLLAEKEAMYGSKPSPRRSNSFRKTNEYLVNGNGSVTPSPRRKSVGSATPELSTTHSYSGHQNTYFKDMRRLSTSSLNFVAIAKEDTMSFSSVRCSEPESPPQSH